MGASIEPGRAGGRALASRPEYLVTRERATAGSETFGFLGSTHDQKALTAEVAGAIVCRLGCGVNVAMPLSATLTLNTLGASARGSACD
jgi:hypothetical protein